MHQFFFLYNGKVISIDKNDLVKDIFKKEKDLNKIIVSDPGDKIQKKQKKILCCWI